MKVTSGIYAGRYKFKVVMAPAQSADAIVVTIGSGQDAETISTSVMQYCNQLQDDQYTADYANAQALARAILVYGQAANNAFSYTQTRIVDFSDPDTASALAAAKTAALNAEAVFSDGTGEVTGASFMALTKPEFRFYMAGVDEQTAYGYNQAGIQVTMTNASQEQNDALRARFVKKADNSVLLEVTGVLAENMDKTITVTITGLGTITFNGNAFARAMANNNRSETQQHLGAALFNYGVAAKTCFGA